MTDDGEHAGVRQNLEVDGHVSALTYTRPGWLRSPRYPPSVTGSDGSADVCHERVESALVVHVIPVAAEPGDQAEQSAKNGDGRRTARGRPVGTHIASRGSDVRRTVPAVGTSTSNRAHQIAQVRSTLCAATRHRHGDSHRID